MSKRIPAERVVHVQQPALVAGGGSQDGSESVTVSIFILSGSQLKATYTLEGPIATPDVDSATELYTKAYEFVADSRGRDKNKINFQQEIDFEHLMEETDDDDYVDDDDDDEFNDDGAPISPDDPDADAKRRQRRERQRAKFLAIKKKRDEKKARMMQKIRQDGEPVLTTKVAPVAGWYRMCVNANWNQVSNMHGPVAHFLFVSFS